MNPAVFFCDILTISPCYSSNQGYILSNKVWSTTGLGLILIQIWLKTPDSFCLFPVALPVAKGLTVLVLIYIQAGILIKPTAFGRLFFRMGRTFDIYLQDLFLVMGNFHS